MERIALMCAFALVTIVSSRAHAEVVKADGYRGIWCSNQPSDDEYVYKYSGGLGTYCAKHLPLAVYAAAVNKTFFVYGGTKGLDEPAPLLEMIGCYDHSSGKLCRPTIVCEKGTADAHHNPTLLIDPKGHLWMYMSAHGGKDGLIYRSSAPYCIDSWERISQKEFTYPQPWFVDGIGHVFLFTKYTGGRELYSAISSDGVNWSEDRKHAGFGGHYQVSWKCGTRIGAAFNWHPPEGGLNARTNLYYMETPDGGLTWTNAAGSKLPTPLDSPENGALVREYRSEGLLVYVKDLNFDASGRPVILYLLSRGYESGPKHGDRIWMTARWNGEEWKLNEITRSDHNYDMGSLYIEADGTWRMIAPTDPGPQAYCTGGEMVMWTSADSGRSWTRAKQLTENSELNHTYARRPVDAHPGFYAFWADGNALKPSESRLYFCDRDGRVRVMPSRMEDSAD